MLLDKRYLEAARELWDLSGEIKFLRRVENHVYEASTGPGEPVILRLTEPSHRSAADIESELDWMSYLSAAGVTLASPFRNRDGTFVSTLTIDDSSIHAALFKRAPGGPLREKKDFSPKLLESWGAYFGKMHRLTRAYRPPSGARLRRDWDADDILAVALKNMSRSPAIPKRRFEELLEWLKGLPREGEHFGLVHGDLHHGNFFVDGQTITAFDFDDACYHWFVYDLAAPLFSLMGHSREKDWGLTMDGVLESMLKGYETENSFAPEWLARLDGFYLFRVALLYHWLEVRIAEGLFQGELLERVKRSVEWCAIELEPPLRLP